MSGGESYESLSSDWQKKDSKSSILTVIVSGCRIRGISCRAISKTSKGIERMRDSRRERERYDKREGDILYVE